MKRRNIIKTVGVAGGTFAMSGVATAETKQTNEEKKSINPDDWIVDIDVEEKDRTTTQSTETEIYVGPNKNADINDSSSIASRATESGDVGTRGLSWGASATLLTWTAPDSVPVLGGNPISLEVSVSLGLGGASASIDLCANDVCIGIGGFDVGLGLNHVDIESKGTMSGVPYEASFSLEVNAGVGSVTNPDPSLTIGTSGQVCLGQDLCDEDSTGWENVSCMLCATGSTSNSLI